ncbi:hypothetical protein BDZ89DRAFT_1021720 [Hymenopellis radicata]|nr:hypothetical protein BDZ89DRAFT_1021720 [Hymenopellis radicata]
MMMLQTTKRALASRCILPLKPRPIRLIGALQKQTFCAPSTRPKLPRVSVDTRAFHNSDVAPPDSSTTGRRVPFELATTWPEILHTVFRIYRQPHEPLESRLTPYSALLLYCQGPPEAFEFVVAPPDPLPKSAPRDAVDFDYLAVYNMLRRPVMIVQIKHDGDAWIDNYNKAGLRAEADKQIRRRIDIMLGECPLPRLWGLSFLGTSFRIYRGDVATGNIEPAFEGHPCEGAWNIEILSQEGLNQMKEVIRDIRVENAVLR